VGVGSVGYGGLGYGWVDGNGSGYDPGYGDTGYYDGGPYPDGSGVAADGYGTQAPGGEEPPIPYVAESPDAGNGYGASVAQGAAPISRVEPGAKPSPVAQPSLYDDEAVTLIFKDGRAPETIHNYALTRTTLYVTDARRQEIPVAALDLAATEKVNRAVGVRFQLPVTQ